MRPLLSSSLAIVVGGASSGEWSEIGMALSRDLGAFGSSSQWEDAYAAAVLPHVPASSATQVFVPFSGGDVRTALAVNRGATEFVLADRSPFFGMHHPLSWNASELEAAAKEAGNVFRSSHRGGFQLGHLVRAYGRRFGVVGLLLAVLKDRVLDVEEGVVRCEGFDVRYVPGDLYDPGTLSRLRLRKGCVVLLKGTELALQQQHRTADDFRGSKVNVEAILQAQDSKNRAVQRLLDLILDVAGVLVQDYTGVPIQHLLRDEAWTLYPFGRFRTPLGKTHPDVVALADYFNTHRTFDLGSLRFGYCQELENSSLLLDHAASLPAYEDDDDNRGSSVARDGRLRRGRRRKQKKSVASCHLVVATRES